MGVFSPALADMGTSNWREPQVFTRSCEQNSQTAGRTQYCHLRSDAQRT